MGQFLSSVHAASFDSLGRVKHKFPVPSDDEGDLPPMHHNQHPLPPPPTEPNPTEPTPMSSTQTSSGPGSSAAVTPQHEEISDNADQLRTSGESMSPTKEQISQPGTVKNDEGDTVPRIPIGRGALKKVYSVLKDVAFPEHSEVKKLPTMSEHGLGLSDDSSRQTDLEIRFKPKRAVFLRGAKRGALEIVPKQPITEAKRGAVWPSRARPHRAKTAPSAQKQPAEPLASTSVMSAEQAASESPVAVPDVDMNRNISAITDSSKSPEESPESCSVVPETMQLETTSDASDYSLLEEKKYFSDLEKARQLSLIDSWLPGIKEKRSDSLETVEKPKKDLEETEEETFQKDLGEAYKRSLLDNWSPETLELDEDPEATVSPLQSDEEKDAPISEAVYRFINEPFDESEPFDDSEPLDLTMVPTTVPITESKEQALDDQSVPHSPRHGLSPQPGPSSSKADENSTHIIPLTEEQQFLRDMEMARQLSLKENWKCDMGVADSSDED